MFRTSPVHLQERFTSCMGRFGVLIKNFVYLVGPKKLIRLIKMCLTETYNTVRVGKNLSDMFPIRNGLKQGDVV